MKKTDGGVKSYGGPVEAMAAAALYKKTVILFYKTGEEDLFSYVPYPFLKVTKDSILLFNCKLNEHSKNAIHWEALTIDFDSILSVILSTIEPKPPKSKFRKVKSNRKVKTPLFTKKRY